MVTHFILREYMWLDTQFAYIQKNIVYCLHSIYCAPSTVLSITDEDKIQASSFKLHIKILTSNVVPTITYINSNTSNTSKSSNTSKIF